MTPQQLMDMPYAGMAERELRKIGKWTLTKEEKMKNTIKRMNEILNEIVNMAWDAQQ